MAANTEVRREFGRTQPTRRKEMNMKYREAASKGKISSSMPHSIENILDFFFTI